MAAITLLARPEILAMKPYRSARTEGEQRDMRVFLDANENPFPPFPGAAACTASGRLVVTHAGEDDAPQCVVGGAVAAAG